jgi:uncharacterized protein
MFRLVGLALTIVGAAWPASAQNADAGPSFDCAEAAAPIETLICADATLADLDRALAETYRSALATRVGEAQLLLREEQRAWAQNRSVTCGVEDHPANEDAAGCLIALYRARIAELRPGTPGEERITASSGYGWLMGDWKVAGVRKWPTDAEHAVAVKAQIGRTLRLAEGPITTLRGASCSFPRYSAEPASGPQFGDLSDYPTAVMVRLSCVGIALLDVVRLTDDRILIGEGEAVLELERRR